MAFSSLPLANLSTLVTSEWLDTDPVSVEVVVVAVALLPLLAVDGIVDTS